VLLSVLPLEPLQTNTCSTAFGHNIKFGTYVLYFDKGSDPEAIAGWVRGNKCWEAIVGAKYMRDWDCNEEAVVIKIAVPYTVGFVLVHTARIN